MKPITSIAAACLLTLATAGSSAWAQGVPEGRVYSFHSKAQGGCPALDWHIVAGAGGALSGMIAWDDMKAMAKATGSVNAGKVQLTATEIGGQGRKATANGTIGSDGYFTVDITAPNVTCKGINIPFYVGSPGSRG